MSIHSDYERYDSPFSGRYGSKQMQAVFSPQSRYGTWRRLWLALAEVEAELGLPITEEQLSEMRAHLDDIDFERANELEKSLRHDVMAHVHAYGEQCPKAAGIMHLGATSCFIGDNAELILIRQALKILEQKLLLVLRQLADFASAYRGLVCLGFTHFQPAQPTTVGKRATLWMQDLLFDLRELRRYQAELPLRGAKGTTGTQASFLELFGGDEAKVFELDRRLATKMGFASSLAVTGQTYTRKLDSRLLDITCGIGESAHKMTNDIRLLQHLHEIEEPFGQKQIGSSAMAYKRNPMRSERVAGISRHLFSLRLSGSTTVASQWLERSLDDSANRRITISEACLAADAVLDLLINITDGLIVHPKMIARHLEAELPFMATEVLLMAAVLKGGDRQVLHECIRQHAMAAAERVRDGDGINDLLSRLADDDAFGLSAEEMTSLLDPKRFAGLAERQTERFLEEEIRPLLDGAIWMERDQVQLEL